MTGITNESRLRSELVTVAESLFHRGLTAGSSGNISVRLDDGGFLMTPTNSSLGRLDGDQLSRLDAGGRHIDGGQPTKEAALHRAMHQRRPGDNAVVHLHSPHATAVSCLDGLDHRNCIPPLTAYHVMRVGPLPLVAYHRSGDPAVVAAIAAIASDCHALLLANHGPIVGESTLQRAAVCHRRTRTDGQDPPPSRRPACSSAHPSPNRRADRSTAIARGAVPT
jgi:3-dehydro-4-phosphotetronate decarboxylase